VAVDGSGNIYVANIAGSITVFAAGATGNVAPLRTITGAATGLNGPGGITLDSSGKIYVANGNGNSITVFAAGANGNVAPVTTIAGASTLLAEPDGLVVGSNGSLFVTNFSVPGVAGLITVYASGASGNVAPSQALTGLIGPTGISL
jgi:sugar lactone lactonase YvrE